MNLRTLKVFVSIADYTSFSKAAEVCGLTQSAVSQIVQQLEEHLAVQLIDRSRRPLELTPAGKAFCEGVRPLLKDYQRVEEEVRSFGEKAAREVVVASIYSIGLSYMPEAAAEFKRRYPEVSVQVDHLHPEEVYRAIEQGSADFGLISYPRATKSVDMMAWRDEPMVLVCGKSHPLSTRGDIGLSDLDRLPLVGFEQGLQIRREIDHYLSRRMIRPKVAMEFDNIDSLVRAMQVSGGIGILPEPAVRREIAAGALVQLHCEELQLTRPLGVIWRRGIRLGKAAAELLTLLVGRAPESVPPKPKRRKADAVAVAN